MTDSPALQQLQLLRKDLLIYAPQVLKVKAKEGAIEPMKLNRAQLFLHSALQRQMEICGWIRALVLKGRQQGVSTYTAARYYHKSSLGRGRNTYILTHDQPASDTLFEMVDRFQRNAGMFAPHVGKSNAKELEFDKLESSYAVATAGAKAAGRSKTIHAFHGSEVAFWPNAADHFSASVQAVPLLPGTEVILESTSAGAGGEFYERCLDAQAGRGDYILIFLPWWLSDEYQRDPEPGFVLSTEEIDGEISEYEYATMYGLDNRQMAWRRAKIHEMRDILLFRREYPATVEDAWTAPPGHVPYIDALSVMRARKRTTVPGYGPLIIGVDPASQGGDRFAVCWRRGLKVEKIEWRPKVGHEEAVAWLRKIIDEDRPARMNIDMGSIGANIVSSLRNLGPTYLNVVRGVNFGGTSEWRNAKPKVPGPYNRRMEMWERMKEWLDWPAGVSLPDDGALQADLTGPKQKPRLDNFSQLESKEDMKNRGVRSPDLADSVAITFAFNEFFENFHQPVEGLSFGDIDDPSLEQLSIPDSAEENTELGEYGWMS